MYETDFDSWAYRFLASIIHRGKLNIFPNVNLVSNIGFGEDATHTKKANNQESNIPTQSLGKIIHPKLIEINYDADKYQFEWSFGGRNLKFPRSWAIMPKRILYFIFRKISQSIKLYFKFSKPKQKFENVELITFNSKLAIKRKVKNSIQYFFTNLYKLFNMFVKKY